MKNSGISRKDFLRNSAYGVAGLTVGSSFLNTANAAALETEPNIKNTSNTHILKNVRLETGFIYKDGEVNGTKTSLFTVEIAEGKIKSISSNTPTADAIDAKGLLMLPAFRDMHIHL
ncbi:MAG: deaminase, partial [Gelidibacter sp.]